MIIGFSGLLGLANSTHKCQLKNLFQGFSQFSTTNDPTLQCKRAVLIAKNGIDGAFRKRAYRWLGLSGFASLYP